MLEHDEVGAQECARVVVVDAERSDHVPGGIADRNAGVRPEPGGGDNGVTEKAWIELGVLDDKAVVGLDGVGANGFASGDLADGRTC